MEKREILTALEEGRLRGIIKSFNSTRELEPVHQALFHKALELGVPRVELVKAIDDSTFDVAKKAMLDHRDLKQMSRKMLEDYDPRLAVEVYRTQVNVMITACETAMKQRAILKPEEHLFNTDAYGQTLSTAAVDGHPEVAVFTGLAKLDGETVTFGRIGADKAYNNLKANPHAVFTAVGPSNDPTKYAFITIDAHLDKDITEGPELEGLRKRLGSPVVNCMVFSVSKINVVHLPKPKPA
ncbi:MAG TPA: hypothetical protein PLT86_06575 [Candidatus Latescibacteria bacterium]|nr:hypothetical protein [Candidatus Latescibacterota bacterium]HQE61370.1 hypothetical protein [Candidatus Latescibacterota bacterium]